MTNKASAWAYRRSTERGQAEHGWLSSRHTFSFAGYMDPEYMGFGPLRVINEDQVKPAQGFGRHPHQSMEIISYVLDGELEHKDSMGNGSIIQPGDVQLMSAGDGIFHSEYNPSPQNPVHFLQIWIVPQQQGGTPGYQQKAFTISEHQDRWRLLVSPSGVDDSLQIKQDARLYGALLGEGRSLTHDVESERGVWLQVAKGQVRLDNTILHAGDAAYTKAPQSWTLTAEQDSELLLFDLKH